MTVKVLFVCTGNICRSPTAKGVLRHALERQGLAQKIIVDSAGTHGYHIGEAPDPRSIAAAKRRQIDISSLRARRLENQDFHDFHLLLALDAGHLRHIRHMAPSDAPSEVALLMEYAGLGMRDVPDPYYKDAKAFEHVLDLLEQATPPMIERLKEVV